MEWIGLAAQVLGLVLFLLKKYADGAKIRAPVEKAREIIRDGETEAAQFAEDVSRGEVRAAGTRLGSVLDDLDALGGMQTRPPGKPTT